MAPSIAEDGEFDQAFEFSCSLSSREDWLSKALRDDRDDQFKRALVGQSVLDRDRERRPLK